MEEDVFVVGRWWSFLLRGLVSIIVGVILIAWPGITVTALAVIVGLFALIDGLINVGFAIARGLEGRSWGWTLAWGLFSILLGGLIMARPEGTVAVVAILAGLWVILVGIVLMAFSFDLPPDTGRGFIGLLGLLSIIIGIVILAYPANSAYAVAVLVGIYALIKGVYEIFLAIMAFGMKRKLEKG